MMIKCKNVPGDNILEQNQNRIYLIKEEKGGDLTKVDKLFESKSHHKFKEQLSNVLYEEISELFVSLIYEKIDKESFIKWYVARGEKGCFDLIKYCKLY